MLTLRLAQSNGVDCEGARLPILKFFLIDLDLLSGINLPVVHLFRPSNFDQTLVTKIV